MCKLKLMLVTLLCILCSVAASKIDHEWEEFKMTYGKKYDNLLYEAMRHKIFRENRRKIYHYNKFLLQENDEKMTYKLGMNHFGDMLHTEFTRTMNSLRPDLKRKNSSSLISTFIPPPDVVEIPDSIDWRKQGAVTGIKDQGMCGSCWAFSATGSLEGQHFRKTNQLTSLSEQNLIDCSWLYGNMGCNGGLMDNAFQYVKENHGIDTEKSYPYQEEDESCHYNPKTAGATDVGYTDLPFGDEFKLQKAVATLGPISIGIDASSDSFMFYNGGIYYDKYCSQDNLDHGVLVVGYGTENGKDFWIVKNSWGKDWGEDGYIRMSRNRNNNCGIASMASYPLV